MLLFLTPCLPGPAASSAYQGCAWYTRTAQALVLGHGHTARTYEEGVVALAQVGPQREGCHRPGPTTRQRLTCEQHADIVLAPGCAEVQAGCAPRWHAPDGLEGFCGRLVGQAVQLVALQDQRHVSA